MMNVDTIQVGTAPPGGGGFPPNTTIPLGTGNALILNEQIPLKGFDKGLTVNAIHLHASGLDAVVASSQSDISRCPNACAKGTTQCVTGLCSDLMTAPHHYR